MHKKISTARNLPAGRRVLQRRLEVTFVPQGRVELPRPCGQGLLRPSCLPFHHHFKSRYCRKSKTRECFEQKVQLSQLENGMVEERMVAQGLQH